MWFEWVEWREKERP
jgi:hypothetical protein